MRHGFWMIPLSTCWKSSNQKLVVEYSTYQSIYHSKKVVRLALQWPSISTRILIRNLSFLAKLLLSDRNDTVIGRIFTSIAIVDINNVGIIQQCRMLEAKLDTHILTKCLKYLPDSAAIVKASKQDILRSDYERLVSVSSTHPFAKHVATVAQSTSWSWLWDMALDCGVQGTQGLQLLLKMLSYRIFDHLCPSCGTTLVQDFSWFKHVCLDHPNAVNGFTSE